MKSSTLLEDNVTLSSHTIIDKNPTKDIIKLAIPDKKRKSKGEFTKIMKCLNGMDWKMDVFQLW